MKETDLPCSECGASLVEHIVFTADLPADLGDSGSVRIAQCESCGARYYPNQTLVQLSGRSVGGPQRQGG